MEWEQLSQDQRWHYRNRAHNTQRSLDRRERHRAWVYERKQERGCRQCGETDGACLDFHHRAEAKKHQQISEMITFGYGRDKLAAEIENCDVLCANCHRQEHCETLPSLDRVRRCDRTNSIIECGSATLSRRERQRTWIHQYKRDQGCAVCGETNPVCLDFHHPEEKAQTVSQLISEGRSTTELFAEIEKCEVRCANCHRKAHYEPPAPVGDVYVEDGVVRTDDEG